MAACSSSSDDTGGSEADIRARNAKRCGGFAGLTCSDTEYCDYTLEDGCGRADAMGTCKAKPGACAEVFFPTCGCDGKTYTSPCDANFAGVAVFKEGACEAPAEKSCGGHAGLACADDEYCDYKLEDMCGAADHPGTCKKLPGACAEVFMPVCGCDGKTYSNACDANFSRTAVAKEGACGD